MIEFLTLLLGLSAGPQNVEVSVAVEVAEVHLLLDGVVVAKDEAPPWTLRADLGADLRPHLLEAVSYDKDGAELDRAEQLLNLPRPPAEARIVLEKNPEGRVVAGNVTWESAVGDQPVRVRAWLDGEPLGVVDPSRVLLPEHDRSLFHVLRVELDFSAEVMAEAQLAFGGTYLDEAQADLTALPVLATTGKGRKARPAQMAGWFREGGAETRVVAFEKGPLDLVIVRGPGVAQAVRSLPGLMDRSVSISSGTAGAGISEGGSGGLVSLGDVASANRRLQEMVALEPGRRLRLLLPGARAQVGRSVQMDVFALSPEIPKARGGLAWALQQDLALEGASTALRLADAVAVAGLQAASGNRRRAVLLVLGAEAKDESRYSGVVVRDYLRSIHVPIVVWRVGDQGAGSFRDWGQGAEVDDVVALRRAARRLKQALDQQRVVWLDGRHLLDRIQIAPHADVGAVAR